MSIVYALIDIIYIHDTLNVTSTASYTTSLFHIKFPKFHIINNISKTCIKPISPNTYFYRMDLLTKSPIFVHKIPINYFYLNQI